ncbi:MAG: helix-turn-helix domain-containing protein [Haloarculaceae archaeon]
MVTSIRDYLRSDVVCEDLLPCFFGLHELDEAVYRALARADEPLTVDAVASAVDRDRTTTYRSLTRLAEAGLVEKAQVNYEDGGYCHVYALIDPSEVAEEMQASLNDWYRTIDGCIAQFRRQPPTTREDSDPDAAETAAEPPEPGA